MQQEELPKDEKPETDLESAPSQETGSVEDIGGAQKIEDGFDRKKAEWIKTSPQSPRNWPSWRKWNVVLGLNFFSVVIFISATGFVTSQAQDQYGVGEEVSVLGQSMYFAGIAIGPMFLAPLSEIYGRQPIYLSGIFLFSILQIPAALSPTFAGLVVTRFFTGCFAGIPISNVGASAADLYPTSRTSWAIILFSFTSQVLGPYLGPFIGGAVYVTTGTLKWWYWSMLIFGMLTLAWAATFGETLHDKVYEKFTALKKQKSTASLLTDELFRSFRLLFTEPIVIAFALTTTYLFGMILIYLQGYPDVFEEYNFNSLEIGAMFLVGIGGGVVALVTQPIQNWLYERSARFTKSGKPRPEARLYTACLSVWMMPASIFWFAFTTKAKSYQLPMWSGFLFGYAEVATYAGVWQYVTDAYGEHAGSALAACNLPANTIAAGLSHAALPMFANEGNKWALATLGFISLGFLAVPPLVVWKGEALRKKSKFALSSEAGAMDD